MYKIILDKKPDNCMNCPLKVSLTRDCGTIAAEHPTSGAMVKMKRPDSRCLIKKADKRWRGTSQNNSIDPKSGNEPEIIS